jgi:hypothetical protein
MEEVRSSLAHYKLMPETADKSGYLASNNTAQRKRQVFLFVGSKSYYPESKKSHINSTMAVDTWQHGAVAAMSPPPRQIIRLKNRPTARYEVITAVKNPSHEIV